MQVINPPQSWQNALGTGLSSGLQLLAQNKMQEAAQRAQRSQAAQGLKSIPGITPEMSEAVSLLPSNLQELFVKQHLQAPQNQAFTSLLSGLIPGLGGQQDQESAMPTAQTPSLTSALGPLAGGINSQQALELAKLATSQRESQAREKNLAFKETADVRKEVSDLHRAASKNLERLDEMKRLNDSGELDNPHYVSLLEKFKIDYPALLSPGSQQFKKLQTDFIGNAKDIFGSRVTNLDISTFLNSIPSLTQSKEGKERVIEALKYFGKADQLRFDIMDDIIKKNKGIPPLDLREQIERKASSKLDSLSEHLKKVINPSSENKSSFNELPSASQYNGKKIRDKQTGEILVSNGVDWVKGS